MTNQKKIISFGLCLIGYGILVWSEGLAIALAIFFIQWCENLEWEMKYDKK